MTPRISTAQPQRAATTGVPDAPPRSWVRSWSLSRITSVCSSGRHFVEADRIDARSYRQTEGGRYPLPGYPRLGHPLLSVIPDLLRSFEPPTTAVALHTRRCPQVLCFPNDDGRPVARRRTGIQGCFLRTSLRAHHTILPSTIQEPTQEAIHQRNTNPILHLVQRI